MKNYCFGDSFIGIFTLVDNCRVFKFKGATAKGLARPDSVSRLKINDVISSLNLKTREESCFIFQFGSVDIHHSYYYKLFTQPDFDPDDIDSFIGPIVEGYIRFIQSLNCLKKIILAPHYSPIEDNLVLKSLVSYGIIREENLPFPNIDFYLRREWRNRLVDVFCDKLKQLASKNISIIDLRKKISENGILRKEYIDQSKYNIHLIWESLILAYLEYLRNCGITKEHIDFSKFQTYIEEKRQSLQKI